MPRFLTRFSAAALAFVFAFSSVQFSAENLFVANNVEAARGGNADTDPDQPAPTPTVNPADGGGDSGAENNREITTFSTLGKAQSALTAQEMRGYQSLYEMQAELFAECVAKLKSWDGILTKPQDGWPAGAVTDLDKICAEERREMNEQGVNRLLIPDATREQLNQEELKGQWWKMVIDYWFGKEGGLLPELKQTYTETLRSVTAPAAGPENAELKKALENWYGAANSLGGSEFLCTTWSLKISFMQCRSSRGL